MKIMMNRCQGLDGPAGFPGIPGGPGAPGLPGADGRAGVDGETGLPGDDGAPGLRGLSGKPGYSYGGGKGEPGIPGMLISNQIYVCACHNNFHGKNVFERSFSCFFFNITCLWAGVQPCFIFCIFLCYPLLQTY